MACRAPISGTKQSVIQVIYYLGLLSSFIHHLSPLSPQKIVTFLSFNPLDPRPRMAAAAGFRRVAVLDPRLSRFTSTDSNEVNHSKRPENEVL